MGGWIERVRSPSLKRSGTFRRPRWVPILMVLALAAFAIFAIHYLREPVLEPRVPRTQDRALRT
jgi:hypothetical protein